MICVKCGLAYKDFSAKKGLCKNCMVKEFAETPVIAMPKEDIANAKLVYRTDTVGRNPEHQHNVEIKKHTHGVTNIDRHNQILRELNEIYARKNADYGNSFSENFEEYGLIASVIRLEDKFKRFKRLSKANEAQVKDESIRDTLVDLANYAIMTVMEIDKNGKK